MDDFVVETELEKTLEINFDVPDYNLNSDVAIPDIFENTIEINLSGISEDVVVDE